MLVFNVTFRCRPGMRETFLEKIRTEGIDVGARAEAGNLQYDYFRSAENGDDLLLIEKYRDADAVAAHVRQAHTARLVALKEEYVADMVLEKYEA
jgi:quinol monooxygenase YgiN